MKKMQNKTIMRYYYTFTKWLKLKRLIIPSVGEDMEQWEFSYFVGGSAKMAQLPWETAWQFLTI